VVRLEAKASKIREIALSRHEFSVFGLILSIEFRKASKPMNANNLTMEASRGPGAVAPPVERKKFTVEELLDRELREIEESRLDLLKLAEPETGFLAKVRAYFNLG
jgi:hypothetical protein